MDFYLARNSYSSNELLSMKQVAELTGYTYWYIRALRSGDERTSVPFPEADTTIGRSPLWTRNTIVGWLEARGIHVTS